MAVAGCAPEATQTAESEDSNRDEASGDETPTESEVGVSEIDDSGTAHTDGDNDDEPGTPGYPNGSPCADATECESGHCFTVASGDGSFCSECSSNEDCEQGACVLDIDGWGSFARCSSGEVGSFCEGDEDCASGNYCVGLPNSYPRYCGACRDSADCDADELCSGGGLTERGSECIAPGSLADGSGCPVVSERDHAEGDRACASGHCNPYLDFFEWQGVCGACGSDDDCAPGELCQFGDLGVLEGRSCQVAP